jgi:hypothetical protein
LCGLAPLGVSLVRASSGRSGPALQNYLSPAIFLNSDIANLLFKGSALLRGVVSW